MKKLRLIPVLLLRDGWLVQSRRFAEYRNIGSPIAAVARLSEWASDEMIYLDISKGAARAGANQRIDIGRPGARPFLEILGEVSRVTFMPLTAGGGIRSLGDIEQRIRAGADKVTINTAAVDNPEFVDAAAREFGSQAIVVSIDARVVDGGYEVVVDGGSRRTGIAAGDWATQVAERGAGEILINSVDRDGTKAGYDLELLSLVAESARVPIIGCGGAGDWEHMSIALQQTGVDAVAAANIFHHTDQSVYHAKRHLHGAGLPVRPPDLLQLR